MSNRPDMPPDEYARGNTPVSRAYRALPDDGPPPELDGAILAKARAAVADRPASALQLRRWRRIAVPVALAASVVMAVSVVLEVNKQPLLPQSLEQQAAPENRKPDASSAPSTVIVVPLNNVAIAPPEVAVQAAPAPAALPAPRAEADAPQQTRERMAASINQRFDNAIAATAPAAPIPAPPPAAAEAPATSMGNLGAAAPELRQQTSQSGTAADSAAMAKANSAAPVEVKSELPEQVQRDAAQWLAAIQALRKAGNTQAADREWLAFRKAWPNYPAPADASGSQSSQSK